MDNSKNMNKKQLIDIFKGYESLTVLCGAGISLNSGLPLANNYLRYLFTNTGFSSNETDMLLSYKIPFEDWVKLFADFKSGYFNDLLDLFKTDEIKPNTNHYFIAKLAKCGIIKDVYTVNFDLLLEMAFEDVGLKRNKDYFVIFSEEEFERKFANNVIRIIKLHGSAEDYESIRITLDKIVNQEKLNMRKNMVKQMVYGNETDKLLILGYSCSDIFDISPAIADAPANHKEIFLCSHSESVITLKALNDEPFSCYNGYKIFGNTDNIITTLWNYFNLGELACNKSSRPDLLSEYLSSYFKHMDHIQKKYLLSLILQKISAYQESNNFLNETDPSFSVDFDQIEINKARNSRNMFRLRESHEYYFKALHFKIIFLTEIVNDNKYFSALFEFEGSSDIGKYLNFILENTKNDQNTSLNITVIEAIEDIIGTVMEYCSVLIMNNSPETIKKALELLNITLEILKNSDYIDSAQIIESKVLHELAILNFELKEYRQSITLLENACKIKQRNGDLDSLGNSLLVLADAYFELNEVSKAKDIGMDCLKLRNRMGNIAKIIEINHALIKILIKLKDKKGIVSNILQQYEFTKKYGYPNRLEEYVPLLINFWLNEQDFRCLKVLLNSIKGNITEKNNKLIEDIGEETVKYGEQKRYNYQYCQAMHYYHIATCFFEAIGYKKGLSGAFRCVGIVCEMKNRPLQAEKYYNKSLSYTEENDRQKAFTLAQLGLLFCRKGNMENFRYYYQLALDIFLALGDVENANIIKRQIQ